MIRKWSKGDENTFNKFKAKKVEIYENLETTYPIVENIFKKINFRSNFKKKNLLLLRLLSVIMVIPKLRGLLIKFFRYKFLLNLSVGYSIIDIHFFSPVYDRLIEEFKKRGKKVKITIWGSDFYRVDTTRLEQQRRIYQIVDIIQVETQQILKDFKAVYPEYEEKLRIAHFGISQFNIIDDINYTE